MPRSKKTPTPSPQVPAVLPEDDDTPLVESRSLTAEAEKELDPVTLSSLKLICHYIKTGGLSVEEACILSNVDYESLQEKIQVKPIIGKIIAAKELEFKHGLLKTITSAAIASGDEKQAGWLLERRFPEEFNTKRGGGGGSDDNVIAEAVEFVRKSVDKHSLVSETSGRAIVVRKVPKGERAEQHRAFTKVEDILK